jgi:hypothetical protein
MQVLLNTEPHTKDRPSLAAYLEGAVTEALSHYGARMIRVEAYLSDANSPSKADTDDIHCTLEAQLAGIEPIVVKERAATARQAIHGALGKLERAVAHAVARHDPQREKFSKADPLADVGGEPVD